MVLEVRRLHLASLRGVDGLEWPVHGFVVTHPRGAVLVDTGVGGPQEWLDDWDMEAKQIPHRHVSHLYGIFPSSQITPRGTPELAGQRLGIYGLGSIGAKIATRAVAFEKS